MDAVDIIIRPFEKEKDEAFIYSSWRNASYFDALKRPDVPSHKFYRHKTKEIREILESAHVRIACFKDDKNIIAGYSVSRNENLDFIYVKVELRGKGIGNLLFPKYLKTVGPQLTKTGKKIVEKKNLITKGETKNGRNRSEWKKDKTKADDYTHNGDE